MCGSSAFQPLAQLHIPHDMTQFMQSMFAKYSKALTCYAHVPCQPVRWRSLILMYNVTLPVLGSPVRTLRFSLN